MNGVQRLRRRAELLATRGWGEAEATALAADASFRSYQRLAKAGGTAVLMDAPPPQEDVRPFVTIARWLRNAGYSAPDIFAVDEDAGFLLLEDLGDDLFARAISLGADEVELYAAAVNLLADMHARPPPLDLAPYSLEILLAEVRLLVDWYAPQATGAALPTALIAEFDALWRAVLSPVAALGPPVTVLRDYHAENLLWLPGRAGLARVGLLDFQDALAGSPAYDLVSLLDDIRRVVPEALAARMIARYLAHAAANLDAADFELAYALLRAQRNVKIIGIFSRLSERDGKAAYLDYLPRLWRLLERDLEHPALAGLKRWFAAALPPEIRP
jgi:aminoglycoside/choline kinase family phosphotransferase